MIRGFKTNNDRFRKGTKLQGKCGLKFYNDQDGFYMYCDKRPGHKSGCGIKEMR